MGGGFRDSGGSLYLRMIEVPATVLVSAARRPEGAKFGFCFSAVGPVTDVEVDGETLPVKASFWEGKGFFERL